MSKKKPAKPSPWVDPARVKAAITALEMRNKEFRNSYRDVFLKIVNDYCNALDLLTKVEAEQFAIACESYQEMPDHPYVMAAVEASEAYKAARRSTLQPLQNIPIHMATEYAITSPSMASLIKEHDRQLTRYSNMLQAEVTYRQEQQAKKPATEVGKATRIKKPMNPKGKA